MERTAAAVVWMLFLAIAAYLEPGSGQDAPPSLVETLRFLSGDPHLSDEAKNGKMSLVLFNKIRCAKEAVAECLA